ncbi:MAG: UDP-2,3-diacylglucosamine diphosphatase [Tepidimonas sp.]|nr:UDP-2,3-diacylglucosamine diphosphatase [Tepidimonas sp.]MCX7742518.1 UDP-2,3-diacylglucosamine diphosphatase [Tepidimonas sp.]
MRAWFQAVRTASGGQAASAAATTDADDEDAAPRGPQRLRTVFISDVHLGTPGCQAKALLAFLKAHPSDRLYLVGDIIDGWQLRRRWYWPQSHNDVVQKILRRARKGCQVIFIPGNHDEFARHFVDHQFGGVDVLAEAVHVTADGRRLWVTHGDLYDGVVQYARWLAYLGDTLYEWALRLNRHLNSLRARLGLPYWSLSQYLKHRVKSAVNFITRFEQALAHEARRRGLDGVVCGHIHRPEIRVIDGVLYCNDGDWVESLSALVEHRDGRLELVHWGHEGTGVSRPTPSAATVRPRVVTDPS